MFEKLEEFLENVLEAFKSLVGKADAVEANTTQLHQLLQEAKTRYEESLEAEKELREAMARYFGLLLGPDAFAVMAGKRRTTKKTDVVEMVIDGGWVWYEWEEGKWDWCLPVVTILLGEDWKTPIAAVPDEWGKERCRLRIELVPPLWEKAGLEEEHQVVHVPLGTLLKGCDYLGFEKLVLLVPIVPITHELFTHKECDVCSELVLLGPIKRAHRKFYYLTLALMGIRAFEQFRNLLWDVQHNPKWGEETFQDKDGNTVTWTFLWWLVDQIIKIKATSYDAEVALPDNVVVSAGTDPTGEKILANDWFLWFKGQIIARLWKYADEIYEANNFQIAMDNRPPSLDHKTITDAKIRDGLWKFRTPAERWAQEVLWRKQVDRSTVTALKGVQRGRGDLELRDVFSAFSKDLLFQWMPTDERKAEEKKLIEWWLWEVYVPRIERVIFEGGRGYGFGDAAKMVMTGLGEYAGVEEADFLAGLLTEFAWLCSIGDFLASVGQMKVLKFSKGEIADEARKAFVKREISSRELALLDTTFDWPEERGASDEHLKKVYKELRKWFDHFLSDGYRKEVQSV